MSYDGEENILERQTNVLGKEQKYTNRNKKISILAINKIEKGKILLRV